VSLRSAPPRWLIAAAVLITLGLTGGGWLIWQQRQTQARQAELAAQTAPVERREVILKVTAAGSIRPTTPVNISPKQPGRIAALTVDQGDQVRAGQILARMDDSNLRGTLLRAQGTVAAAVANLNKLQAGSRPQEIEEARRNLQAAVAEQIAVDSTYRSNLQLYGSGAIARVTFEASRSAFLASEARVSALKAHLDLIEAGSRVEDIAAARAQLQQARGDLTSIQAQLEDTVIRAPFTGVITQKYADVGAFVTPPPRPAPPVRPPPHRSWPWPAHWRRWPTWRKWTWVRSGPARRWSCRWTPSLARCSVERCGWWHRKRWWSRT
jgi:HlyD family secretion protein